MALLLPTIATISFHGDVSSAQGWFTAAAAGASLMVGVYGALVFRPVVPRDLKTFDPKDRDQFVRRRRDISVVYLGSILLWFALLFWSGSQPEAKALYFSVETREHAIDTPCQFAVCSKEISSRLSYLDALYVAGGAFVTVGAAGITPLAPETRIWLLIEYVPLVVGALGLIRRDAP